MFFRIAIALILSGIGICSAAQPYAYSSIKGNFTVDAVKGCAPLTVNLYAPICDGSPSCDLKYRQQDGTFTFTTQSSSHLYDTPGSFYIVLLIGASNLDSILIDVVPNIQPAFDAYLCSGNQVTVKLNDINYEQYIINFGDASAEATVPPGTTQNHTYGSASTFNVSVRGKNVGAADNCFALSKPVKTGPFTAPVIDEVSVNNQDVQLTFNAINTYYLYKLEIATNKATGFQQLGTPVATNPFLISTLRPDLNYYCFRLNISNACTGALLPPASNILCSVKLDVTAENNQNRLVWQTYTPVLSGYNLKRNGVVITSPPAASLSYIDTNVACKQKYTYELTALSGASKSISNRDSVIAFSTTVPTAVTDITAVVGQSGVDLEWQPVSGFTPKAFQVYKNVNGESFQVGTTTDLQISDPKYTTATPACYYILYEDVCDNQSPSSIEACPIRLSSQLKDGDVITLNWSDYTGWQNGVASYTVEKFDAAGQSLGTFNVGSVTTFEDADNDPDHQVYQYVIRANSADGLPQAVSNEVMVIKNANIYHPTAFTPDHQGPVKNEKFRVFGKYVASFELQIYTRWGEPMFITNNIEEGWDGTFKGTPMPEGTYTFVATVTDLAGRTFKRSGNVLLIRKNK